MFLSALFELFHSEIIETTMSTSTTRVINLPEQKKKNEAWIRAYKKASGQKKQTVLPSAVTQNNEWAVRKGWSMQDATTWRGICEKAKYASDEVDGDAIIALLLETIEIAGHCDTHPIGIIHFARTQHDRKVWDLDTLDYLQANLLGEQTPPGSPRETEPPGAPVKRRRDYEATQPDFLQEDTVDLDADDK